MLILFLTPDVWYWRIRARAGAATWLHIETSKLANLNEDDNQKLTQIHTVMLLLLALSLSSLSNIAVSTTAAKQHQIIVFFWRLAGWSHFDDLSSRLETLPYTEQRTLSCSLCVFVHVGSVHLSLCLRCRLAPTLAAIGRIDAIVRKAIAKSRSKPEWASPADSRPGLYDSKILQGGHSSKLPGSSNQAS